VWSHIIQPKSGQTKFNGLTNVWPSTGEIWLKTSRLRHAVYRWCIVTLIIAHVSPNVSLENVTFESHRVWLYIVTFIIANVDLAQFYGPNIAHVTP
jgi:hypothetical protein